MKHSICVCILGFLVLLTSGCTTTQSRAGVAASPAALASSIPESQTLQESLFKEDQSVMSNDDMAKVLAARVVLPTKAKLAVIRFGQLPYWWGWSESFVRMNEKIDAEFLGKLKGAARLREVSYLPSLVTPREMTIPYLRQAAARFQADLILVYRTSSRTYDKERFLGKDQTRAYCTVEAVLIDTRTGIIPFSTVVTETFAGGRSSQDLDFSETIARAEQQAIATAWMKLAEQTVRYLDGLTADTASTTPLLR